MRKEFLVFIGLLLWVLSGCKQFDKLTKFDMKYSETFEISSSTAINLPFNIFTPDIETNSESEFAVNDTRKDLVEEIQLTTLRLAISSPSNEDFSFLKSINIFINAEDLSETKLAWIDSIPTDNAGTLTLETTNEDLKEYIKKDDFTLRLNTVTDELITTNYQVELSAIFYIDAKILGQ
jgi:hypothetical protein